MSEGQRFEVRSGDSAERTDQPGVGEAVIEHIPKFEGRLDPRQVVYTQGGYLIIPLQAPKVSPGSEVLPEGSRQRQH
jgi:hypothetical protein